MSRDKCLERLFRECADWQKMKPEQMFLLKWHMENYLFPDIDFKEKRFLDIGGGVGTYSFYAACRGACEVVCLEPEAAGSSSGMREEFQRRAQVLGMENVRLLPLTFQEYDSDAPFDILFCHNAINHLDESAVVRCHYDPSAQDVYVALFHKMRRLCVAGGYLIIADASRYNLWATLGRPNPLCPTIEWHKHQSPRLWKRLCERAGFQTVSVRWRSPARLGKIGQFVFGNEWVNYFFWSHFCLTLRAV